VLFLLVVWNLVLMVRSRYFDLKKSGRGGP